MGCSGLNRGFCLASGSETTDQTQQNRDTYNFDVVADDFCFSLTRRLEFRLRAGDALVDAPDGIADPDVAPNVDDATSSFRFLEANHLARRSANFSRTHGIMAPPRPPSTLRCLLGRLFPRFATTSHFLGASSQYWGLYLLRDFVAVIVW